MAFQMKKKRRSLGPICDELRKDVGKRVKKLMVDNDLTLAEMARMTGLSRYYLSRVRSGAAFPGRSVVAKRIAVALDTTVDFLLFGEKER
jgi:transcriptional regulator with XRE-family HTH domain